MKKAITYITLGLMLTSCVDYQDVSHPIDAKVQLQMPTEFTQGTDFEGHDIVLTAGGQTLSAKTDATGIAVFPNIIPNVYDISTYWNITSDQYQQLTGEVLTGQGCTVSGSINEQLISEAQVGSPILLPTYLAIKRDIVISKIASAGSKDGNNRNYMAGKYLELYNQADESVDASGLYIGLLDSTNPQPYTLTNLHDKYEDSVVVVKQVFQIPADEPFMVAPGGTILLTNSATDHSDINDKEYDLRDADFESKDATGKTINNPATPALITAFSATSSNATMNLVQGGPCGVIIFRTNENIDDWIHDYAYGKTSGQMYLMVPRRVILDGVDYLKNKSTGVDVSSKRLYADIDAGYTNIEATSGYTGEVVYRRTEKIAADGHKILMDTNNSLNDFKVSTTIKPREYDE